MSRTATRTTRRAKVQTALAVLKADHAEVSKLFKQFDKSKKNEDDEGMQQVVQAACKALSIHDAADADNALNEADVEHSHVKELVAQLEHSAPGDELFEARVKVLSEYVQHHVEEEEHTIFAKARKADLDLVALGKRLRARKEELGAGEQPLDVAVLAGRQETGKRNGQRATR